MCKENEIKPDNLCYAMQNAGYDIERTASRLGCSKSSICHWIKGRKQPAVSKIIEMAVLFNCSTDYLLGISEHFEELKIDSKNINITFAINSIGTRIEDAKIKRNFTCSELARELNVKPCTVYNWITGVHIPNGCYIAKIARILNVSTDYLLGLTADNATNTQVNLDRCICMSRELTEQKGKTISYGETMALKDGYYNVCKKSN